MPKLSPPPRERERLHSLWNRLHAYIRNRNSWITSEPGRFPLTCRPDSDLPKLLANLGYQIKDAGTAERFMPVSEEFKQAGGVTRVTVQHLEPVVLQIWELSLQ
jgi:hypothetical protein